MSSKKNFIADNAPLSRFGVLVAQLESIVASASQQSPDPLLCFDLLSDLITAIREEPQESILLWQRKCEDSLYSLLVLGARRPVRHLASVAMAKIIYKGDSISIYSRASSLQGFLSDCKKSEPHKVAGAAQCLGELYQYFGRKITSGLHETTIIATKLMKFHEDFVRQEALLMLQKALEGCGGSAASSAYTEAFRLITRFALGDKSFVVRIAAAHCLKAFASIGGPGLGVGELDSSASYCVKALEDPVSFVRDAFAEALGSLLALGMNPESQVHPRGKGPFPPAKKLEGGLQRHLALPFVKANGTRLKDIRIGVTLAWVSFLQAIRLKYQHSDSEFQNYALQVMEMLRTDTSIDAHALACILYILRVGVTDQMTEPTQRAFLVFLGKQLESPDISPSMRMAALRTLSYTLKTLGEVPSEFKEVIDNTIVAAASHSSQLVRIEAALALRALAEVDPTCVGGLVSYGVTTLSALRENVSFEKGSNLIIELDSLHGQATILATLVSVLPKLPLGYPARLPKSVLEVSKKMLTESSRNPVSATVEKEAGWLLISSLLSSMPKQELDDEVFDILSLWAALFSGNPEIEMKQNGDLALRIRVWSAAVDALTAFIRCFISPNGTNNGVLLQPVLVFLSSALSYILLLQGKEQSSFKPAIDIFIIRTLVAYQSLPDPTAYKSDHPKILHLCTLPYKDASKCEESSCLRSLLDKRDAWLGPLVPGRDWFEDELRSFQGGKDGLMPCLWDNEPSSFPQPETINKTLVNQMLLCFGIMFATQDSRGMLLLLGMIEQCLKVGKKQMWHAANVTNICVGLLSGLKALIASRPQPLGPEILNAAQAIFQNILSEGDICLSQRRASSEGLGLLARLGNDIWTARMTRLLLGDLTGATDSSYAGSIAFALGCIHRSAGGMALSSLVPATVSSVSLLAKSSMAALQLWSMHGLLLTIEASGFSYVSHVQATLGLAMDILLSEENGLVDLKQGVGRLINAIVAVLGPELAPGSIFFSRCKSVIAEISSRQETATLLESVRFTQQLVLFAPHAVSVHSHVQTLVSTLSSRQPTLRHIAVSTLRHLIEKDPASVIDEQVENNLFHMLDEETDSEIGSLVRATIMRLLSASCPLFPSHWISICRGMILSISGRHDDPNGLGDGGPDNDPVLNFGEDDENMVSSSKVMSMQGFAFEAVSVDPNKDKHLRHRTRYFAAECLSHLPTAVGKNPAHFDLTFAREKSTGDWLVLHVQELISLAYQISTIQFENMRPIGVRLLSTIVDKFESTPDPELPGHLLLEQFQAQLVSAVRTALDESAGPILLEAGLHLATKIMTSGILGGDQIAVRRIFSLISRPLNDFNDLYYPSFAEWVSCKIKIRLLAAHASLKCYTFAFLRRHQSGIPDEYLVLLPLFSKSSSTLGKYWIQVLKDYTYICLGLNLKKNWKPLLDGIQSPLVSSNLQQSLEEAWPVILQALALDAVPANTVENSKSAENMSRYGLISGYSMVELEMEEYQFLWGFALLVLFQQQNATINKQIIPLRSAEVKHCEDLPKDKDPTALRLYEVVLPVFQFLSTECFSSADFFTVDICRELLQVFSCFIYMDDSWHSLAVPVLAQIVQNCPEDFLQQENCGYLAVELLVAYILNIFHSISISPDHPNWEEFISPLFIAAKTVVRRFEAKNQSYSMVVALLLIGYKSIREASTEFCFSTVSDFVKCAIPLLKRLFDDSFNVDDGNHHVGAILGTCLNAVDGFTKDCIQAVHVHGNKRSDLHRLLQLKLSFFLEQTISFAKLAYESQSPGETKGSNPVCLTVFKNSIKNIRTALSDANLQVQGIGLQALKTMVQRTTNMEYTAFLVSFSGELLADIFTIFQTTLKKPVSKESVVVAGECLRLLLLLQTLSKGAECQIAFMNLLLEAIVMVFLSSEDNSSQEVNEIRTTAVRLVSHLAQIPSSAVHFKDALLSMPAAHRGQLQGVIRASMAQDHVASQKPTTPFEIKLPLPKESQTSGTSVLPAGERTEKKYSTLTGSTPADKESTDSERDDDDDDDDDDWDAFQSFPATTNAAETTENDAEEPGVTEKSVKEFSTSHPIIHENDTDDADLQDRGIDEVISSDPGNTQSRDDISKPKDNRNQRGEEEAMPEDQYEVGAGEDQYEEGAGNVKISSDPQSAKDVEGSSEVNSVEDDEHECERLDDIVIDHPKSPANLQGVIDQESMEEQKIVVDEWHGEEEDTADDKNDVQVTEALPPPENNSVCEIDGGVEVKGIREKHLEAGETDDGQDGKEIGCVFKTVDETKSNDELPVGGDNSTVDETKSNDELQVGGDNSQSRGRQG